jgi:hypothetical protein
MYIMVVLGSGYFVRLFLHSLRTKYWGILCLYCIISLGTLCVGDVLVDK